ncbi:MAG: hypothetical protein IPJ30_28085 [Acidobacteria bacterium]|nr:hypothetical protein [Acidobacteriota bacterium]
MRPIEQTGGEAPRISKAANDTADQFIAICDFEFAISEIWGLVVPRGPFKSKIPNPKSREVSPTGFNPDGRPTPTGTRFWNSSRPNTSAKPFLGFFVDEADGVADYVFKAMSMMASGGISIVLMTANPRLRSSAFHRLKKASYVKALRISSLYHPNVVQKGSHSGRRYARLHRTADRKGLSDRALVPQGLSRGSSEAPSSGRIHLRACSFTSHGLRSVI